MHLKTYRGEKLNKCNQCDYASVCDMFSSLTHLFWLCHVLKEHLEINSGEKPNKCNQCNYASASVNSLKIHLRTYGRENQTNTGYVSLHPSTSPPPRFDTSPPPKKAHLHPLKSTTPPPKMTHFPPNEIFSKAKKRQNRKWKWKCLQLRFMWRIWWRPT